MLPFTFGLSLVLLWLMSSVMLLTPLLLLLLASVARLLAPLLMLSLLMPMAESTEALILRSEVQQPGFVAFQDSSVLYYNCEGLHVCVVGKEFKSLWLKTWGIHELE